MKRVTVNLIGLFLFLFGFTPNNLFSQSSSSLEISDASEQSQLEKEESKARQLGLEWNRQSIELSIEIYTRISQNWLKLHNSNKFSICQREAGKSYIILGDKVKANDLFMQALNSNLKEISNSEQIKTYGELSIVNFDLGKVRESKLFMEKALTLSERTQDVAAKATALFSAGEFYFFQDDLTTALSYYLKANEYWKISNDLSGEAKNLMSLGYLYLQQNRYSLSTETFNSALLKWREIKDVRGEAITLKAIATNLSDINRKQEALKIYTQSEKLFPNDIDFKEKAVLYNGLSGIYEYYGEWEQAIIFRKKALFFFQKDNYQYGQLATYLSLGRLQSAIGNEYSALQCLKQVESLAVKLKAFPFLADNNEQIGKQYFRKQEYQKAELYFQKSLTLLRKGFSNGRQTSRLLNSLGILKFETGAFASSKNYFLESLKINQKVLDRFAQAESLFYLSKLYNIEGNDLASLKFAQDSIETTEMLTSDVVNSKLKSTYFSGIYDHYELYINLLMKINNQSSDQDFALKALQAVEKSRARSMLENLTLSEANFTKDADVQTIKQEMELRVSLNAKADKITDLLSQNADKSETNKLDGEINELRNELETIKADLKQKSPVYSAIKNPAPFDVGEFQRDVLDENSLLLEFSFGKDESYLWLVGKNEFSSYILPPREEIETKVETLRELIAAREMKPDEAIEDYQKRLSDAESQYQTVAKELSKQLFGQIGDKFSGKRLIIVPDGKLHYFPVAALPLPNSIDDTPILLTNETIYEPSAATLALLMRNGQKPSAATKNLLVFSDPIFSNQDARVSGVNSETQNETGAIQTDKFRFAESLTSLVRLNASKDESDSIIEIVGASESTALSGAAATREKALDASIGDYKIIHFATHGLIKEDRPELSGIVLSQVDGGGQPVNGVVRLQDIYAMNLSADAVVLSACDTGIGKEVKGEGLMSLNNAFLQTGAKTVVSTLWKVDDYAARELMKNFYSELASGKVSTSEALRRAQIKLRQNPQYQSPFYWAAFTIEGDYQNIPQFSVKRNYKIYALVSIILLGLFALYLYRRRLKSVHKIR